MAAELAPLMHEAGLSLERIGDYIGHSSTYMTDRYRHLLEGHERQAADLLDAYLARSAQSSVGVVFDRRLSSGGGARRLRPIGWPD